MDGPDRKAAAFQWCLSALSNTGTIDAGNATLQLTDELPQLHNGTLTGGTLHVMGGPLGDAIVPPFDDVISSIAAGVISLGSAH